MKATLFLNIAFRIIVLFLVAMVGTYIPDYIGDFFGDHYKMGDSYGVDKILVWGIRHWMYVIMTTILFTLSFASLMVSVHNLIKKEYNIDIANKPEFYQIFFFIVVLTIIVISCVS